MRRRLFGRSQDSSASLPHSSRFSPIPSPTVRDTPDKELKDKDSTKGSGKDVKVRDRDSKDSKEKDARDSASLGSRHAPPKKSVDGGRHGHRLSIFGGTFAGTLGKSRKPAPRCVFLVRWCRRSVLHFLVVAWVRRAGCTRSGRASSACRGCPARVCARCRRCRSARMARTGRPRSSARFWTSRRRKTTLCCASAHSRSRKASMLQRLKRRATAQRARSSKAKISWSRLGSRTTRGGCARRATGTMHGSCGISF